MFAFRALFFLVSILCAGAIPASKRSTVVHEQIQDPPPGFVSNGPASPDTTIKLRLALTSSNITGLESILYDVSTPKSQNYGRHLTKSEVESYVAPSTETKLVVQQWLQANDIPATNLSAAGDWILMTVNISQANDLFDAQFDSYTYEPNGQETIRTLKYSLPANLMGHVDAIHPTVVFPSYRNDSFLLSKARLKGNAVSHSSPSRVTQPRSLPSDSRFAACDAGSVTPACIQHLYGLPPSVGSQNASGIGVAGFLGQFAQKSDFTLFLETFRPDLPPNTTFAVETIDGGLNIQALASAGSEANLDVQYTAALAGGVPTTFISVGNDFQDGTFLSGDVDILLFVMEQDEPPLVLTTSFGQDESTMPPALARKFCDTAAALGVRGVSLLYASGDGGVGGGQPGSNCTTFKAVFPAGCPHITSVGATQGINPESAANFTAGGFSNIFPMPAYQKDVVNTYLKQLGETNAGLFNSLGRAYPDVSVHGSNVIIASGGAFTTTDGTSCSSPIFASIIGALNALRLQQGKSPLGFLNPLIYSNAGLFQDITTGSNPGCGTDGFPATTGWDPVTGMGTPIFEKFQELP